MRHFGCGFAALVSYGRPTATLVDAVDIMEDTGPTEGLIRRFGFIFSGVNCISIDSVMATCIGIDIHKAPLLHVAEKNNYRGVSLDEIEVAGETIENVRLSDFAFPAVLTDISFTLKGVIRSLFRHLFLLFFKERKS